jgi:hypothetical protein
VHHARRNDESNAPAHQALGLPVWTLVTAGLLARTPRSRAATTAAAIA